MSHRLTRRRGPLLAVVLTLVTALALSSAGAGTAVAQTAGNASAANTTAATPAADCQPDGPPPIERTWLQLEDERIEAGDPGKIAFQHNLRTTYDCPVTVLATIYAPDGVELKVSSGGTVSQVEGAAQATYRIDPTTGSTLDGSAIEVYYDGPVDGTKRIDVDATAQLFAAGHRDDPALYTEVGGLSESLTVTERTTPATPSPTPTDVEAGADDGSDPAAGGSDGSGSATATPADGSGNGTPAATATPGSGSGPGAGGGFPWTLPSGLTMLALIALVALVAVVGAAGSD